MIPLSITPGHGVGVFRLGAGLYDILTALKVDSKRYPKLDVSYSQTRPLVLPVTIELPENGLRLRFDGPQQRLRLVEILDLQKSQFTVKNEPLVSASDISGRLLYRRVYSLFGASYPGEYISPANGSPQGIYVVSYPGVALSFPIQSSLWSSQVDHAKMLADSGASVSSVAIFEGKSWAEARDELWTRQPSLPQSLSAPTRHKEGLPDEVEFIQIVSPRKLLVSRRASFPITITLDETTAQDLINDFGPPDATFKRSGYAPEVSNRPSRGVRRRSSSIVPRSFGSTPSSVSSTNTDTYDADFEEDDGIDGPDVVRLEEQYYCYFSIGFDLLLGPATDGSGRGPASPSRHVVTRVILHGNVPGSFEFNRHRRSRWSIDFLGGRQGGVTSEAKFSDMHGQLMQHFRGAWPEKEMKEGMVIVRDWAGDSPSGSAILIGEEADDEEEEPGGKGGGEQWLKNTQLYKFPGLMFEVMHNGSISALTVYGSAAE